MEHVSLADLPGFTADPEAYTDHSVSDLVRHWARTRADEPAYISPAGTTTWADYDRLADRVCAALLSLGEIPAVAVYLPDTVEFHGTLVGAYRAGVRAVAVGARSGPAEVAHLMSASGSTVLVTVRENRGVPVSDLVAELRSRNAAPAHLVIVDGPRVITDSAVGRAGHPAPVREFSVDDVCLLNSTSGTTGRPKLVMQTQRRWSAFAAIACRNAEMDAREVVAAFVPAPFGFGLWTSHFLPALLGRPALVMHRFDPAVAIDLMAEYRATILACVSTQFRMMLQTPDRAVARAETLRVMFTGGEAVPHAEARRFEEATGALVLQFYGSNETGAASATTVQDDDETRLGTGGRLIEAMNVRILDDGTTGPGVRRGQPAVRGPLMSPGYWNDDAANAELFTDDGWIRLGDIVEVDDSDRLRVVGRLADLIIRGGKNISALEVEDFIREHPAVEMVAAVGVPDPLFGERLCAAVTLTPGTDRLSLADLNTWLRAQGITREYLPERLRVLESMPLAPGGKIAKAQVEQLVGTNGGDDDYDGRPNRR
ncbi:class I adenylate-forming enzyme family protein [Nocardia grenadensis]|uniref:class I adenylate-forming enzyme family protein n=1 Tax=Nocardia grenadensis TaxID=931537 RepID=UPI0009FE22F8|nr:class I adenylate-forming enzyme family protein [Nocardia grenadensis]